MSTGGDGPKPLDINAVMNQANAGKSSGGTGWGESEQWGPLGDGLRRLMNPLFGIKFHTAKSGGIDAHFSSKGFLEGSINKGAASMSSGGGFLATQITKQLQLASAKDFSKLGVPDMPRLEVKDAPIDTSTNFTPSATYAGSGGRGSTELA